MATYNFRVLLETVEGKKTSYYSSSFVDTSTDLVLSASQVYDRITGSVSCSYYNAPIFEGDINNTYVFKDNTILSASLTGSLDTGAITFKALNDDYDRLLRYKFFGTKVCNTLGLPNNQWIYVDQFRLPADDESNYFEGNILAKNIYINDNLSFANNSSVNTDVPFSITTGSDRHIKFIDERFTGDVGLYMGYDKSNDVYEVGGDKLFHIKDVDKLVMQGNNHTISSSAVQLNFEAEQFHFDGISPLSFHIEARENNSTTTTQITQNQSKFLVEAKNGADIEIRTTTFNDAIYIDTSAQTVGIGTDSPDQNATLHVAGNLLVDGAITSSVITSSVIFSSGSNIFGDAITDTHTFNGHITASGNISASGEIVAARFHSDGNDTHVGNLRVGQTVGGGSVTPGAISHVGNTDNVIKLHANKDLIEFETSQFLVESSITASGNISSSGHLFLQSNKLISLASNPTIAGGFPQDNYIGYSSTGDHITIKSEDIFLDPGTGVGIGNSSPTKKLTVEGDISASGTIHALSHITASGNISASGNVYADKVFLENNDVIRYSSANSGLYVAGGIQTIGDSTFGNTISDEHTFNGHITASGNISGSITSNLTMGGNIIGKTYKSEKLWSYLLSGQTDGTEYFFPVGSHYDQTVQGSANTHPQAFFTNTAMCDLSIKRLKIQFPVPCVIASGDDFKIYCKRWDGAGSLDNAPDWENVGTAWTVKEDSNITVDERFFHAPSDWNINAGEIWTFAWEVNGISSVVVIFSGGVVIEEDWNTLISS